MTIILTNDDGIDAEGIWSLQKATELVFGFKGAIAAPSRQYSGCGHQVTTNEPISIAKRTERIASRNSTESISSRTIK